MSLERRSHRAYGCLHITAKESVFHIEPFLLSLNTSVFQALAALESWSYM
jgi:hypothetical protein